MCAFFASIGRWIVSALWAITPACVAIALCAGVYWHTVNGDRGTLAQQARRAQIAEARDRLDAVTRERQELENRVNALRGETLDLDLLDERARRMLNQFNKDELVVPLDTARRP